LTVNDPPEARGSSSPDNGLRRMLTWTFAALIVSLVMAYIGVTLAILFFDRP
jgi:type VI protein secretion system component VasF